MGGSLLGQRAYEGCSTLLLAGRWSGSIGCWLAAAALLLRQGSAGTDCQEFCGDGFPLAIIRGDVRPQSLSPRSLRPPCPEGGRLWLCLLLRGKGHAAQLFLSAGLRRLLHRGPGELQRGRRVTVYMHYTELSGAL